ncbi:MAG TPA: hypothetical protein VLH84_05625 [Patescibacteria group bacterium]|nr:hypothetical protein [Patescibacteria group bacterium]
MELDCLPKREKTYVWDDDDDDEPRPYKKQPIEVGPSAILWLFAQTTLRVMVPALTFMALGIWIGNKVHHKQAVAIVGTLVGLAVAAVLVWQQAKSARKKS